MEPPLRQAIGCKPLMLNSVGLREAWLDEFSILTCSRSFGDFELEHHAGELRKDGTRIPLEEKHSKSPGFCWNTQAK